MNQLQLFLDRENIDIVFLSETFLKEKHTFYLNNYKIYRNDRSNPGGGVALCIKSNIKHKLIKNYETSILENISIIVTINGREITFTSVYNPKYTPDFKNDIKKITPHNKEFVTLGDLNAKHFDWQCVSNNRAGIILRDLQLQANFFVNHPNTHNHFPHSGTTPSTIDILLTNSTLNITQPITHDNELPSDHSPVTCSITAAINTINPELIPNYKEANWLRYQQHILDNINHNQEFQTNEEIDSSIERLIKVIHEAKNLAVPKIKRTNKMLNISNPTKNLISERNNMKRNLQRCHDPQRKIELKQNINELNRKIKTNVDLDRNNNWSQTLSKLKTGTKKFWHITKKIKGKYTNKIT